MANWNKINKRGKVQDRRGMVAPVGGIGIIGIGIVLAVAYFGGGEQAVQVMDALQQSNQGATITQEQSAEFAGEDDYEVFASRVVGVGNDVWKKNALKERVVYREPTLVLFRGRTDSACGGAVSSMGPHYCPVDETIYLDETFFEELTKRFGARGGDVAEAYVIAHEIGHHVQKVFGTMGKVRNLQAKNPQSTNKLSVKQELQADCYAGIWANSLRGQNVFEEGEIIEAMDAAAAVGDDHIQEVTQGKINSESWTHGSSEARQKWFKRGYEKGNYKECAIF